MTDKDGIPCYEADRGQRSKIMFNQGTGIFSIDETYLQEDTYSRREAKYGEDAQRRPEFG